MRKETPSLQGLFSLVFWLCVVPPGYISSGLLQNQAETALPNVGPGSPSTAPVQIQHPIQRNAAKIMGKALCHGLGRDGLVCFSKFKKKVKKIPISPQNSNPTGPAL